MEESQKSPEEKARDAKDQLNNWVAVAVALIATFTGITKIKDDNIVQAMLQMKSDAVDRWNESQASKIKLHIAENGLRQTQIASLTAGGAQRQALNTAAKEYEAAIEKYRKRAEEASAEAKKNEEAYDSLGYRDDQFDMSDMFLSIAMSLLAVSALTGKRWLFYFSMVLSTFGVIMGVAAFVQLHIHPNFLVKFLT
ncbi:MAG TPA: DUF4337 domain-containing protein [Leptospiraceae bacterium]|jgi:hypothetical protein|nr:DUF4337 domain-containing protein [Leptospirales bacterium]HMU85872.1 DUF4337 domain-containing protein [Leptospiraceae bacterium]HMX55722.1 DUF4337 domain-containing protein [Leptospiraceae bacterium]HMY44258.1 DUF4337 domain-containing protein [Leptospiraceae bacterium]HMZ36795.1 DUF4337 domain-containing protein [Leptospiraceae bacterium]